MASSTSKSSPSEQQDSRCSICLEEMENAAFANSCLHRFCFECLLEWSRRRSDCPLCRSFFYSIIHRATTRDGGQLQERRTRDRLRIRYMRSADEFEAFIVETPYPMGQIVRKYDNHPSRGESNEFLSQLNRLVTNHPETFESIVNNEERFVFWDIDGFYVHVDGHMTRLV